MATILVIEDDPVNRELLGCMLRFKNHQISEAADTDQALLLVEEQDFDLILLDIKLPTIGGLEVLKIIKANPLKANIPVVAVTACASPKDRDSFMEAGGDGYIIKPFTLDLLYNVVDSYIQTGTYMTTQM